MSGDKTSKAAPAAKGSGAVPKSAPKAPASKPRKAAAVVSKAPKAKTPARPIHHPTDQTRRTVEAMAAYRIAQDEIAAVIGIDPDTLRSKYRPQLDAAAAKLEARLHEALSIQALGAPAEYYPPDHPQAGQLARAEQKRYAPAAIFLLRHAEGLKDRAQRRELDRREQEHRHALEREAAAARARTEERSAVLDLDDATPAELELLERFFRRQVERNKANGV